MSENRFHCNACKNLTKHKVLFHLARTDEDEYQGHFFWSQDEYFVVECKGCSSIHFIQKYINDSYQEQEPTVESFPPRNSVFQSSILDREIFFGFNYGDLYHIYNETLTACRSDLLQLAGCGIRLCLETTMNILLKKEDIPENSIEHMSMVAKIDMIFELGYISKKDKDIIIEITELGHASIHRNYIPNANILLKSMIILDSIIQSNILIPEKIMSLRKSTPARLPKPPKMKSAPKSPPE